MKHNNELRIGQMRKFNKYLTKLADQTNSPKLKTLILMGKINNQNGHATQKGKLG